VRSATARRKVSRAGVDIALHHADAARLPFEDAHFDVVTVTTIRHVIPPSRRRLCLGEASRVLKSGGWLLLIDYAGNPEGRRHWSAKYGRHGLFDLERVSVGRAAG